MHAGFDGARTALGADIAVFDAHFHIIDPRFPLVANNGYVSAPFSCADYRARTRHYPLRGGAIVSGSFQAFDQRYLLNALQTLGDGFVGVTQLPASVSDEQLLELQRAGVRGLRFNARRGGSEDLQQLDRLARRVHERVGWHVELYIDASELTPWSSLLTALPAVSVDHLGLSKRGLPMLLTLAELGVRVKATGFGRVDFHVRQALRDLYAANPDALMFGTDLPSTRAPSPYSDGDLLLVLETLGEAAARKVLCDNALAFYRIQTQSRPLPDRDQTTSATVEPTLTSNIELQLLERPQ